jgi:uncharacterized membrane protein
MDYYRFLVLIHVLAGMAWVGGAIAIEATVFVARRSKGPEEADRVMRGFAWADTWLAVAAPLVILATGVAMVMMNGAWTFGQTWILGSIGLVVVYETVALTVGARFYRRIEEARSQGLVGSVAHARTLRMWGRLSAVLLALLVGVVVLMVFKPNV